MAVALTPDAYLSRSGTAWDVYFSWCGWRRINTDRSQFTILSYLGNLAVSGGFQFTVNSSRKLIVYDVNSFTDLLGGAGPTLAVGTWWFLGITTVAADEPNNVVIYYASAGSGSLTSATVSYSGPYDYSLHYVGARPGTDGQDGAYRLHGSAALDRSWRNTTLTGPEMLAEFQSPTPVKSGVWADWRMATAATATDDSSGNGRTLTATTGTGSIATTTGPGFTVTGTAACTMGITLTASGAGSTPTSGTGAVRISGGAKYRNTPASALGLPVSWCGWVRVDTDLDDYTTVAYIGLTGMIRQILLALQADGVTPILYDANYEADITGVALAAGTWNFLAFTAATGDGNLRLYHATESGTLTQVDSGTYDGASFQGGVIELAGRPDGQYPAAISVANQRVWTAALSLSDLGSEMGSETAARTSGLYADWPFQDSATATDDASANNNDLALVAGSGSVATTSGPAIGNAATGSASAVMGITATATGVVTRNGAASATMTVTATAVGARTVTGTASAMMGVTLTAQGAIGVLGQARAEMGISLHMTTGEILGSVLCYLGFVHEVLGTARAEMGVSTTIIVEPVAGRVRAEMGITATAVTVRTVRGRVDVPRP